MSDVWEQIYDPGDLLAPSGDPDRDGFDNITEARCGTDPHDPESFLGLDLERDGDSLVAAWEEQPGKLYTLESSEDLVTWAPVLELGGGDFFSDPGGSGGSGARPERNQATDQVEFPPGGIYKQVSGDKWAIWQEYQSEPFFGGDATLTYRIMQNGAQVVPPTDIYFRIGGANPDDDRCKAYIVAQPNAGSTGSMWFSYQIAKHESKAKNTNNLYYNQFYELPLNVMDVGLPTWNNDGPGNPGGYGVFQITGTPTDEDENIAREQIWNWQTNVGAYFAIMNHSIKSGLSARFYDDIKNDSAADLAAFNACPPPNIVAAGVTFSSDDAIWITAYNGWGGPIKSRYVFSHSKPCGLGSTKRWHWNPPIKPSGKTYLELVAEEAE